MSCRQLSRPPSSRPHPTRRRGDDGQTVALVALLVASAAGAALLIAALGGLVIDRTAAKHAADAAALAAAIDGEPAAERVAAANGAVLERFADLGGGQVEVTVRHGRARATSRAEPEPRPAARRAGATGPARTVDGDPPAQGTLRREATGWGRVS